MINNFKQFLNGKQGTEVVLLLIVGLCASIVHAIKKKYKLIDFIKYYFTNLFISFMLYILLVYQFELSVFMVIPIIGLSGMSSDVIYNELENLWKEAFGFAREYLKSKIKK